MFLILSVKIQNGHMPYPSLFIYSHLGDSVSLGGDWASLLSSPRGLVRVLSWLINESASN